jgi:hypothetical protein
MYFGTCINRVCRGGPMLLLAARWHCWVLIGGRIVVGGNSSRLRSYFCRYVACPLCISTIRQFSTKLFLQHFGVHNLLKFKLTYFRTCMFSHFNWKMTRGRFCGAVPVRYTVKLSKRTQNCAWVFIALGLPVTTKRELLPVLFLKGHKTISWTENSYF